MTSFCFKTCKQLPIFGSSLWKRWHVVIRALISTFTKDRSSFLGEQRKTSHTWPKWQVFSSFQPHDFTIYHKLWCTVHSELFSVIFPFDVSCKNPSRRCKVSKCRDSARTSLWEIRTVIWKSRFIKHHSEKLNKNWLVTLGLWFLTICFFFLNHFLLESSRTISRSKYIIYVILYTSESVSTRQFEASKKKNTPSGVSKVHQKN